MKTKYKHLHFDRCGDNNQWFVWEVPPVHDVGFITYHSIGECYVFQPRNGTEFNTKLLSEIIDFMNQLDAP